MAVVSMKALLETGVHFGHRTKRWNPKMKPFIFTERNGIHIIDLQQTIAALDNAYNLIRDTMANGGTVLFVGTKRQAQETIAKEAAPGRCAARHLSLAGRHAHQLAHDPATHRHAAQSGRPARSWRV